MKIHSRIFRRKGFALIVTLSLMILLTVIAVGLLSLSSISLRSSTQGNAMATARANARMGLMLAIGELQKNAGADQRVTARAEVTDVTDDKITSPKLTGVWDSWEIKPGSVSTDYEKASRDKKFRTWLVSGTPTETAKITFANQALLSISTPTNSPQAVTLWGKGTLGTAATPANYVTANKVPLASPPGALAWAVMDEGVKVRINTGYADKATSAGPKTAQLGAGERPGVEFIAGLNGLSRAFFEKSSAQYATMDKGLTRLNYSLAGEQLAGNAIPVALQALAHDVTTLSSGLLTDTARGGLKQDFHLLTNSGTMPTEYTGKGIYASRNVMPTISGPSDPQWESFKQFATLYKDKTLLAKVGTMPVLKATAPAAWNASTPGDTISSTPVVNRVQPQGVVLMPTIAKVQMLFSLLVRDLYPNVPDNIGKVRLSKTTQKNLRMRGPFDAMYATTNYDYELQLIYTPIVTLHNPYNVAIEFTSMNVEFIGVPFAMKVFRTGVAQSPDLVPLEMMTANNTWDKRNQSKIFAMSLKTKVNEKPGVATFCLLPGEVVLFSPYIDPKTNWAEEVNREKTGKQMFWDNHLKADGTSLTSSMTAMPGWRGFGVGYSLDWLGDADNKGGFPGRWGGDIALKPEDTLAVEFGPVSIPRNNNKFVVQMSATVAGSASKKVSAIEIDYESSDGIQKFITANGGMTTQRFPKTGTIETWEARDSSTKAIGAMLNVKPFALLSAQAKTTSSGRDATNVDGRFTGKPWAFAHASIGSSSQKMTTEHSANHSHELDLMLVDGNAANDLVAVDAQGRSSFITGNTNFNGTKFGALYDIPLAPIQTLAGLNGANPGGSSGYLPRFAQPIGNSWAHPLISPEKMSETGPDGYGYLDHSFLLNLALYDGFYFSGLADQTGDFGAGETTKSLAANFSAGTGLDDPRMLFYPPSGKIAADFAAVAALPTAYKTVAAWQAMAGAFNINSTSVPAWKAMLASIHDSQSVANQRAAAGATTGLTALKAVSSGKVRISRMRLPGSSSAADGAPVADGYWLGPREYTDADLQTLAENIVKQVRLRGPFLSMAEFVNRRLGSASDEKSQRGALQQAIDDSNLNQSLALKAIAGFEIPVSSVANYKYKNVTAGSGASYQGAPGYLTQADLLNVLGNAATARSDTFTIRGYGESRDASGKIMASATCEAVLQRVSNWIDSTDAVDVPVASLMSATNKAFGRRFLVTSFRWLSAGEI
jgi:hypothetical protein